MLDEDNVSTWEAEKLWGVWIPTSNPIDAHEILAEIREKLKYDGSVEARAALEGK